MKYNDMTEKPEKKYMNMQKSIPIHLKQQNGLRPRMLNMFLTIWSILPTTACISNSQVTDLLQFSEKNKLSPLIKKQPRLQMQTGLFLCAIGGCPHFTSLAHYYPDAGLLLTRNDLHLQRTGNLGTLAQQSELGGNRRFGIGHIRDYIGLSKLS